MALVGIQEWIAVSEPDEGRLKESALLQAGRAGDTVALEHLLGLHKPVLVAFCHGILGHAEDAEDAAQETFLRALDRLPSFRGESAFRTWLFRIAANICLRWKATRAPTESWDKERLTLHSP